MGAGPEKAGPWGQLGNPLKISRTGTMVFILPDLNQKLSQFLFLENLDIAPRNILSIKIKAHGFLEEILSFL